MLITRTKFHVIIQFRNIVWPNRILWTPCTIGSVVINRVRAYAVVGCGICRCCFCSSTHQWNFMPSLSNREPIYLFIIQVMNFLFWGFCRVVVLAVYIIAGTISFGAKGSKAAQWWASSHTFERLRWCIMWRNTTWCSNGAGWSRWNWKNTGVTLASISCINCLLG